MKEYNIIYADPPWTFSQTSQVPGGRQQVRPYVAMRQVDVFSLPVTNIAADDCVCFVWVPPALLPEGLYCLKAWGFEFKTVAFTWVKRNKKADSWFWGMGWWTRNNPEYCLMGTKGNPKREAANIHSVVEARIAEHSKKPDEVRDKIVALCGDKPRIELFARQRYSGWDAWGNEVENDIEMHKPISCNDDNLESMWEEKEGDPGFTLVEKTLWNKYKPGFWKDD